MIWIRRTRVKIITHRRFGLDKRQSVKKLGSITNFFNNNEACVMYSTFRKNPRFLWKIYELSEYCKYSIYQKWFYKVSESVAKGKLGSWSYPSSTSMIFLRMALRKCQKIRMNTSQGDIHKLSNYVDRGGVAGGLFTSVYCSRQNVS